MIKLQIIGHLGTDCTTNEVNGRTVINFPVAHSEKYKDAQGNLVEKSTWVRCAYWTDRTGIAQYLKKGQLVYAEGSPEAEGYLNKDNQNADNVGDDVQKRIRTKLQFRGRASTTHRAPPGTVRSACLGADFLGATSSRPNSTVFDLANSWAVDKPARESIEFITSYWFEASGFTTNLIRGVQKNP